ncbi:MAG TPA: cohesin domain-containing protein, partial [bacterium]|nr:cohesin domain-containing protein [bacterium]
MIASVVFFACLFVLCSGLSAKAAEFQVTVNGDSVFKVGKQGTIKIYLVTGKGENVTGGQCTVSVDPSLIELSADRNSYAADPVFSKVERFKADPEKGIITFKAFSETAVKGKKVFIKVPFKFLQPGTTYVSFTSNVVFEDGKQAPANPGYFRLVGYDGDSFAP